MKIEIKITDDNDVVTYHRCTIPTQAEINKEAQSYDNALSSMAEGVWMPEGFREGCKWMREKIFYMF